MISGSKDSPDVALFLKHFSDLKEAIDDEPDGLVDLALADDSVAELCSDLFFVASFKLRPAERQRAELFSAPVDPKFLKAWRDFEERYEDRVTTVFFAKLDPSLAAEEGPAPDPQRDWEFADSDAEDMASAIQTLLDFTSHELDQDWREIGDDDYVDRLEEGAKAWERLVGDWKFDLRGVFRRRALVPFVLVPRTVSNRMGNAEKLSLLENLRQAQQAFIFGTPLAALALLRSIVEAALRDLYKADGPDLVERIKNARNRLPSGANAAALHRLRKQANSVLHLDEDNLADAPALDPVKFEFEMLSFFLVVRALIESAPISR